MFVELVPLAIGVIVSPIAIAAVIALLMTRGAAVTAAGFVVGWIAGLFVMVALFAWLAGALGFEGAGVRPVLAVVEISAAVVLAGAAAVQFSSGRGLAARSLRGLDRFRLRDAAVLGFAGSVLGPKVILLTGVAGVTISSWSASTAWGAVLGFALLGGIGVALPVAVFVVARGRAAGDLERARGWIVAHDRAASAGSLLIVALVLAADAVANRPT